MGDGERKYQAVVEGMAKNTTRHSSEKVADCRTHQKQFYHVKLLFYYLLNLILSYGRKHLRALMFLAFFKDEERKFASCHG